MIEANPVMAAALAHSTEAFAASKMAVTGVCLLVLTYLSKARLMNRVRAGTVLTGFFSGYACLICYQFVSLIADG